jgi:hypothetical protein
VGECDNDTSLLQFNIDDCGYTTQLERLAPSLNHYPCLKKHHVANTLPYLGKVFVASKKFDTFDPFLHPDANSGSVVAGFEP